MDARVIAALRLHLARAQVALADAEAKEQQTPNVAGNWSQRARNERTSRLARSLVQDWTTALAAVELASMDDDYRDAGASTTDRPERIVAWFSNAGHVVCNGRTDCKRKIRDTTTQGALEWFPKTAEDLSDGGVCDWCETDVLA